MSAARPIPIWLPLLWGALILILLGCSDRADRPQGSAGTSGSAPSEQGIPELGSLPSFRLSDQRGAEFGLAELSGDVWIADFIFTSCPDMCPMLTSRMAEIQQTLQDDPALREIRLVSFSVDPENDTPAALRDYAERYGADPGRWTFLTGSREALRGLVRQGFKLPVEENESESAGGPILHSDSFVLVDGDGVLRGYYRALESQDQVRLIEDLRTLAAKSTP